TPLKTATAHGYQGSEVDFFKRTSIRGRCEKARGVNNGKRLQAKRDTGSRPISSRLEISKPCAAAT
ncbi:hypothetical protein JTM30_35365, partial [Pseudomonas aeruginosa]|nr:hypothetical protein [Pseudomonas aeruginosa]MBN0825496.1 hypothetical protein [Pseudomonas aeruginosa]